MFSEMADYKKSISNFDFKGFNMILILCLSLLLQNCKSSKISKHFSQTLDTDFYENQFTGLLVYNPQTKDTVFSYNSNRYFTPASNTKIFTLFAALQYLPEHIPAMKYAIKNDTLYIRGTGDPSYLHPFFKDSTGYQFLKSFPNIQLITDNFKNDKFGPGWAWEDYDTYFSPERTGFPIYGNVVSISKSEELETSPSILSSQVQYSLGKKRRDHNANNFYYTLGQTKPIEVPMVMDSVLMGQLWNDLLPNQFTMVPTSTVLTDQILYSIPSDSLYKRMMKVSDNFLAEQMLILASSTLSDTLDADRVRTSLLTNELHDLKQKPRWVDGSGLSRYNLFTPLSFIQVLEKLYHQLPQARLFDIFPIIGESEPPYIYAKTGSFGNNYALSGYLITDSGKVLIFSFLNNHFVHPTKDVKERIYALLEYLKNNY